MRVIAFTGLPGSGKSVAVETARDHDIAVVRMGQFVIDEVARRGLTVAEENIGPVASGMRERHGADVWACRTIDALRAGAVPGVGPTTRLVVVDGIRSLAEVERFRKDLGADFTLVGIDAPEPIRHERILGRGRADDAAEHAHLVARDEREKGWGIEAALAQADHTLHNDTDMARFQTAVEALFDHLLAA